MTGLKDSLKEFIDYCNEPAPSFLGDAHVIRFDLSPNVVGSDVYSYRGIVLFKPSPGMHPYYLRGYGYTFPVPGHEPSLDVRPMVKIGVHIGRLPEVECVLDFGLLNPVDGSWHTDISIGGDASFFDASPGGYKGLRFTSDGNNRVATFQKSVLSPP